MSGPTGISNVHNVINKDTIFATAGNNQTNIYNMRAALDASKLWCTPYHGPDPGLTFIYNHP